VVDGITRAILANAIFELPLVTWSATMRAGAAQLLSEGVATFGLIEVVIAVGRTRAVFTTFAVAAYVVAAYWFTASTSFANPAVTIAELSSDIRQIRPADVGALPARTGTRRYPGALLFSWLVPVHRTVTLRTD
jgi:hypothetical protein